MTLFVCVCVVQDSGIKMKSQLSSFLKVFDIKYPVIQSPMAGASTVGLATSITRLGGIGSLAMGSLSQSPEKIRLQVESFQEGLPLEKATLVNLNFFTHEEPIVDESKIQEWCGKYQKIYSSGNIPYDNDKKHLELLYPSFKSIKDPAHPTVEVLIKLKPKIVSFHFGLPQQSIQQALQGSGINVFVTATNLEEFKQCLEAEVDGVVLQGWEAGGHRGSFIANDVDDEQLSTMELVKTVVGYIDSQSLKKVPFIIAAGGVYDSSTVQRLLKLNIAGVQVGTVFLPTGQCTISSEHLKKFQTPQDETLMTASISGRNLRTIKTPFLEQLHITSQLDAIPDYPLPYDSFKRLVADAKYIGESVKYSAYLSGSNYDKSWKGTRSVEEVFASLTDSTT